MNPKEARLGVQKMMAEMEADMLGYKITECDTLWNTFSLGEKMKWLYYNVVTSKGEALRRAIDLRNQKALDEIDDVDEDGEETYFEREKYPRYAEPNPKDVISIKCTIKLRKPVEFIEFRGIAAQLSESKDE